MFILELSTKLKDMHDEFVKTKSWERGKMFVQNVIRTYCIVKIDIFVMKYSRFKKYIG